MEDIHKINSNMKNLSLLVSKSVDNFDKKSQDLILIEEMSELTKELLKRRRGYDNNCEVAEEMTHVLTSLYVVKEILGITDANIEMEATKKLDKYGWKNFNEEEENSLK